MLNITSKSHYFWPGSTMPENLEVANIILSPLCFVLPFLKHKVSGLERHSLLGMMTLNYLGSLVRFFEQVPC